MRIHGTLKKWNDDRGFGFVTPAKGPPDVFVHISEFPREGGRPAPGELISFEVVAGPDGKQRAVRVMRPGQKPARPIARRPPNQPQSRWLARALPLVVVTVLGVYGYSKYSRQTLEPASAEVAAPPEVTVPRLLEPPAEQTNPSEVAAPPSIAEPVAPISRYSCDGRTMCSQMRSCEEAIYFLRNCPNTKMDGNNDGEPCEQQWCN